jgi:hypothetical protein
LRIHGSFVTISVLSAIWLPGPFISFISLFISELYRYHNQDHPDRRDEELDSYWQSDEALCEGYAFGEQATIRLKAHISQEHYHRSEGSEIVPIQTGSGTRIYVHAKPYILEPDYRISVGLYQQPTQEGAVGEVTGADWVGMRAREVGQAQAWLYPDERTLVLWECFLEDWYRKEDPRTDENLKTIWLGFEGFLLRNLPQQVDRIATPSWEPLYDLTGQAWPEFLEGMGYVRIGERAYGKDVVSDPSLL